MGSSLALAFERISRWMIANGAAALVENLAPGANDDAPSSSHLVRGYESPRAIATAS